MKNETLDSYAVSAAYLGLGSNLGDRAANLKRAIAGAKERAAKERAYFDDPGTRADYYATRKRNEADVRFCWK